MPEIVAKIYGIVLDDRSLNMNRVAEIYRGSTSDTNYTETRKEFAMLETDDKMIGMMLEN